MKDRRFIAFFTILLLGGFSVYAGAKQDDSERENATGLQNWEHSFDISAKTPGIYNIVVEGKDAAGNAVMTTPINVYVDPASDLPVSAIANPLGGMRVGGDFNIVGTCVDDDGVASVKLKIDDGAWIDVQGKEFWSYFMKSDDIADGRRKLTVYGIDINGVTGPEKTLAFDMDRRKPVATFTSHTAGQLVSGRIDLKGTVYDANSVVNAEYSLDEGVSFLAASGSFDQKTGLRSFAATIDTTKLIDGPTSILIRSKDGVGSVGITPFMLVVDNTKPVVELISPTADETVDGKFQLFGIARDTVGLTSLSWKIGEIGGEIDISEKIGDPYWTVPISMVPKSREMDLVVTAIDTIKNRTDLRVRLRVDMEKDRPKTTIIEPVAGTQTDGKLLLAGFARDDEAVAAVEYWWDNNSKDPPRFETTGAFALEVKVPAIGKRVLNVRAVDAAGTAGPTVSIALEDRGAVPTIALAEVVYGSAGKDQKTELFASGMEIAPDARASIKVTAEGGSRFAEIHWWLAELSGTIKANGNGTQTALIPVPATGPYGNLDLKVEAVDVYGRAAIGSGFIYVTNYSKVRGEPAFAFYDERLGDDGAMRFGALPARPLEGRFVGATLAKLRIEPATENFRVSFEGSLVTVTAIDQAVSGPHQLVAVTDRGHEFRSEPMTFVADVMGPELNLDDASGGIVGKGMSLAGRAFDPSGLASGAYAIVDAQGNETLTGALVFGAADGRFETNLDISGVPDGAIRATVTATDNGGNISVANLDLLKDTEGPEVVFASPRPDSASPIVAGIATDLGGIAKLEFAEDGEAFQTINGTEAFYLQVNLKKAVKARLRATDIQGNTRTLPIPGFMDSDSGQSAGSSNARSDDPKAVPSVDITYPAADTVAGLSSLLVFRVDSPRGVIGVSWTFGTQKGELSPTMLAPLDSLSSIDLGGSFVAVVAVKDFQAKAGSVSASVTIKDAAAKTATKSARFNMDPVLSLPTVIIRTPKEGEILGSTVTAALMATAKAGLASYRIQLDAEAAETVTAAGGYFWTRANIAAGSHALTVTAVDRLGRESLPQKRNFKAIGDQPKLGLQAITRKEGSDAFRAGSTYVLANSSLEGTVTAANGLASVDVKIAGRAAVKANLKKINNTESTFSVPLPPDLLYAQIDFDIQAKDSSGKTSDLRSFFYRVAPEAVAYDQEGFYGLDARVYPKATSDKSDLVMLTDDASLRFRFNGRPIDSILVEPVTDAFDIIVEGSIIKVKPITERITMPTTLTVLTADGDEFTWGKAVYVVDRASPTIIMDSALDDGWFKDYIPLNARLSDANGIREGDYSFDNSKWRQITFDSIDGDKYSGVIKLDVPDGGVLARFRIKDIADRSTILYKAFNKDTVAPHGQITVPRVSDPVNGRVTVGSLFSDEGALVSVEYSADGGVNWDPAETGPALTRSVDFSKTYSADGKAGATDNIRFRATDQAGNTSEIMPGFTVDTEIDKPTTLIQLPEENEVQRVDFTISGAVFDDDAVASLKYKIDEEEWQTYPIDGNSFNIPISLANTTDNDHIVIAYAEDIYGVVGDKIERRYRISKAQPIAEVLAPLLSKTVSGVIDLTGTASDANGIGSLDLSFDNAVTFQRTIGAEEWTYRFDTTIIKDGLHSIYIKPYDKYDTEGFYASLISVDNTPPEVMLDLPLDGAFVDKYLVLSGRVFDSRALESCEAVVFPRGDVTLESRYNLGFDPIIQDVLDLSGFPDGEYGVKIIARDKAGNTAISSRDFALKAGWLEEKVIIAAPVRGERLNSVLKIQGKVQAALLPSSVSVFLDDKDIASDAPNKDGWFSILLDNSKVAPGPHKITARFTTQDGKAVVSETIPIDFSSFGSWVRSDDFAPGAFVPGRPWLTGTAGWTVDEDAASAKMTEAATALASANAVGDKKAADEARRAADAAKKAVEEAKKGREVVGVEVSLDNGRSFLPSQGGAQWKFRLETQDYPEGPLPLVLRAHYRNGEMTVSRLHLNLDKTPPLLSILSPEEGGRFNGNIKVFGIASDDTELSEVSLSLRSGDKAGYELPAFIQGLYLDVGFLGGSMVNAGAGLTFFDDKVKLQAMYGYLPNSEDKLSQRFYGSVIGAKLLASIVSLPFSFWFGPDWDFLETEVALGADVSYYLETQGGQPLMLSAIIGQLEFPKVKFAKLKNFRTISFYTEFQAWMISAEVGGGVIPRMSFGLRTSVF